MEIAIDGGVIVNYWHQRLKLFSNVSYCLFLLSGVAATLANGWIYIVLSWSLLEDRLSIGSQAALLLCLWGPSFFLTPICGVLADRCHPKWMMVVSNGIRGILLVVGAFVISGSEPKFTYVWALLLGCFLAFYNPSASIAIREIVPSPDLLNANATVNLVYEVGSVVGMGTSAMLLAFWRPQITILIGGGLFLLASFLNAIMPYQTKFVRNIADSKFRFIEDMKSGWNYLSGKKQLVTLYASEACLTVTMSTLPALLPVFCKRTLCADVEEFGLLEAAFSLGGILGGIFMPFLAERFKFERVFFLFVVFLAVAITGFGRIPVFSVALGIYCVIGFCLTSWALILTHAQLLTDLPYQGRIQALASGVSGSIVVLFYIGFQLLENVASISAAYMVEACIVLVALVFFGISMMLKARCRIELNTTAWTDG